MYGVERKMIKNWGINTKASIFLFDLMKHLQKERATTKLSLTDSDIQGLAFFIGKVIVLEDDFEKQKG